MNAKTNSFLTRSLLLMGFILSIAIPANALILQWNLSYYSGDHGVIVGDGSQTVLDGNDGTPVGVTADADYFFYRWSDGVTDNPRTDLAVTEDITVTAEYLLLAPTSVYVDDDYFDGAANDGHIWGYDAFDNIPDGVAGVAENGTVYVADGIYEYTSEIEILTPGITITGPTPVDMEALPIVKNYDCGRVFNISANEVSIIGLKLEQEDGFGSYCYNSPVIRIGEYTDTSIESNEIAGGRVGIANYYGGGDSIISNNIIHDNDQFGIVIWQGAHSISGNDISNSGWGIGMACGPDSCGTDYNLSGTTISNNEIYSNSQGGIIYSAGDQAASVTIGPNNNIYDQLENISIISNTNNLSITGNQIHDSINITTGLHIESNEGIVNAKNNWWGSADGPYIEGIWAGSGDTITAPDADTSIFYRPFCTVEDCSEISTLEIDPSQLEDNFATGTFTIVGDDYTNTSQIMLTEDLTISVNDGDGTSTVIIPNGTVISRIDGLNVDGSLLEASELDETTITGLASGDVVYGALNWGIPNLGLQFSTPITISIYVGTDLAGQTLEIKRSTDGITWTSTGIVDPATCLVDVNGLCTFEATKASSYASYDAYDAPSGGGSNILIAYNNPTASGDGASNQTVAMGQSISIGNLNNEGINLFAYINSVIHFNILESGSNNYSEHNITIMSLDTINKILDLKIESEPQYLSLNLGAEKEVDLNNDNIKDIKIKFNNLDVNRIEMTVRSLLAQGTTTITTINETTTQTQNKLCTYTFTRDLMIGMSGVDVRELQKCLNNLGFTLASSGVASPGNETNFFGNLTKTALSRFQTENNLVVSGKLDSASRIKFNGGNAVTSTKYQFNRNLSLGMYNDDVKELQKYLNNNGYTVASNGAGSPGNETMFFGNATRAALIKLQKDKGIIAVGYFGPITRAYINAN